MASKIDLKLGGFEQGLNHLAQIPYEQLYRLYQEGYQLQNDTPLTYDQSDYNWSLKFALDGLLEAIDHTKHEGKFDVSNELLQRIHAKSVAGDLDFNTYTLDIDLISDTQQEQLNQVPGQFSNGKFPFTDRTLSTDGLKQLLQRINDPNEPLYSYSCFVNADDNNFGDYYYNEFYTEDLNDDFVEKHIESLKTKNSGIYFSIAGEPENLIPIHNRFTEHFQQALNSHDPDQVIGAIADYIQRLEQAHPFPDGNGRTFVNSLANYCLVSAGLPPAIYWDPHIVDAHSVEQVKNEIKNGCLNTLKLINGNNAIHGVDHDKRFGADVENPDQQNKYYELYIRNLGFKERLIAKARDMLEPQTLDRMQRTIDNTRQRLINDIHVLRGLAENLNLEDQIDNQFNYIYEQKVYNNFDINNINQYYLDQLCMYRAKAVSTIKQALPALDEQKRPKAGNDHSIMTDQSQTKSSNAETQQSKSNEPANIDTSSNKRFFSSIMKRAYGLFNVKSKSSSNEAKSSIASELGQTPNDRETDMADIKERFIKTFNAYYLLHPDQNHSYEQKSDLAQLIIETNQSTATPNRQAPPT